MFRCNHHNKGAHNALPDYDDCTETCRRCFNVNFNVNFKIVFKTIHLCVSWWIKKNWYILQNCIAIHGTQNKINCKLCSRQQLWPSVRHSSGICLEKAVRSIGRRCAVWTREPSNIKQDWGSEWCVGDEELRTGTFGGRKYDARSEGLKITAWRVSERNTALSGHWTWNTGFSETCCYCP
jgi:hypothetical protein